MTTTIRMGLLALLLLSSQAAWSAQSGIGKYRAYDGTQGKLGENQGYQELRLGAGRWYVAYQGNPDTGPDWIDAAWAVRSAQLCQSSGAGYFIELRYSFEPVLKRAQPDALGDAGRSGSWWAVGGGPVYIPIYMPANNGPALAVAGPAKLASIQCLNSPADAADASRAKSADDTLANAASQRVILGK